MKSRLYWGDTRIHINLFNFFGHVHEQNLLACPMMVCILRLSPFWKWDIHICFGTFWEPKQNERVQNGKSHSSWLAQFDWKMNHWICHRSGFISSFVAPWSKWSCITDPNLGHPKGMHPTCNYKNVNFVGVWPDGFTVCYTKKPLTSATKFIWYEFTKHFPVWKRTANAPWENRTWWMLN